MSSYKGTQFSQKFHERILENVAWANCLEPNSTGGSTCQYESRTARSARLANTKFKRHIQKYKEIRKNLMGNFSPLLPQPDSSNDWDAWQFHNPDTGEGHLLVFRMRGSIARVDLRLNALEHQCSYRFKWFNKQLETFHHSDTPISVELSHRFTAELIEYSRV